VPLCAASGSRTNSARHNNYTAAGLDSEPVANIYSCRGLTR